MLFGNFRKTIGRSPPAAMYAIRDERNTEILSFAQNDDLNETATATATTTATAKGDGISRFSPFMMR
jgi:hypothetical protein